MDLELDGLSIASGINADIDSVLIASGINADVDSELDGLSIVRFQFSGLNFMSSMHGTVVFQVSFKRSLARFSNVERLSLNSEYGKRSSVNVVSSIRLLSLQCMSMRISSFPSRISRLESLKESLRAAMSISSRRFGESP